MPIPVFTEDWAQACRDQINHRPAYRETATAWEGDVILAMASEDRSPERAVYLDLWHGECRAARVASAEDLDQARYVLSGAPACWRQVLRGELAPLLAIMTGKLRLARGSLASLIPYMSAARELVMAAMAVETVFPGE